VTPTQNTPLDPYIAENPKFYPFFKGALEALDGTHICAGHQFQTGPTIATAKVRSHRMSLLPQHSICSFATSSVAGRGACDGGVFHDARVHDFEIPEGKFYLADAGYPLCDVLFVPF